MALLTKTLSVSFTLMFLMQMLCFTFFVGGSSVENEKREKENVRGILKSKFFHLHLRLRLGI